MEKTKSREFQENLIITSKAFSSEEILVCREGSGSWKAVNLAAVCGRALPVCARPWGNLPWWGCSRWGAGGVTAGS